MRPSERPLHNKGPERQLCISISDYYYNYHLFLFKNTI